MDPLFIAQLSVKSSQVYILQDLYNNICFTSTSSNPRPRFRVLPFPDRRPQNQAFAPLSISHQSSVGDVYPWDSFLPDNVGKRRQLVRSVSIPTIQAGILNPHMALKKSY